MRYLFSFFSSVLYISIINGAIDESSNGHELLNEELRKFSNMNLKDGDYEILRFFKKNTVSDDEKGIELRFRRSGRTVVANMKETSVMRYKTPIWLVHSNETIEKIQDDIISDSVKIYEDSVLLTSVAVDVDEHGDLYLLGSLGDVNVIPISNELADKLQDDKPHLFTDILPLGSVDEPADFTISKYHVMYTPSLPINGSIVLPPMGHPELFRQPEAAHNRTSYERLKRSTADVIYPEILLVLDYNEEFTSARDTKFIHLMIYTMNFWNSVNLRFSTLKDPEIRLRIAGIVVSNSRTAVSYIKISMNSDIVDADSVLKHTFSWVYSHIPVSWDIVLTQTSANLYSVQSPDNLSGLANVGARCGRLDHSWTIGIFHDDMAYSGVITAAHEIGHILGADHDEATSPANCLDTAGYIMSMVLNDKARPFEWSECSKTAISHHLRNKAIDCYDNSSPTDDQGELIDIVSLPGYRIEEESQCLERGYAVVCDSPDICKSLRCRHTAWFCVDSGPALDGTQCPGGRCQNGDCVESSR